jgi:hypothetical protein
MFQQCGPVSSETETLSTQHLYIYNLLVRGPAVTNKGECFGSGQKEKKVRDPYIYGGIYMVS